MKTNPAHLTATQRHAPPFTRFGLAWLVALTVLAPARGANTFTTTGALSNDRYQHTETLLYSGKADRTDFRSITHPKNP